MSTFHHNLIRQGTFYRAPRGLAAQINAAYRRLRDAGRVTEDPEVQACAKASKNAKRKGKR